MALNKERKFLFKMLKKAIELLRRDGYLEPIVFGIKEGTVHLFAMIFQNDKEKEEVLQRTAFALRMLAPETVLYIFEGAMLELNEKTIAPLSIRPTQHPQHLDAIVTEVMSATEKFSLILPFKTKPKLHLGKTQQFENGCSERGCKFAVLDLWLDTRKKKEEAK